MKKRLGLTMRVDDSSPYGESRDCIAIEWANFLSQLLPEWHFVYLPNIGPSVVDWAKDWGLEGLVFTGGNDLGSSPRRDTTEQMLLEWGMANNLPILGVCRGFQLLVQRFGGAVEAIGSKNHAGKSHRIDFEGQSCQVNSYHNYGVRLGRQGDCESIAWSQDGWVEAIVKPRRRCIGIQWHPERDGCCSQLTDTILTRVFGQQVES